MSLQGLISGSECAVASNPLSQVLKHTEGDRSLQQDRSAGPSSARLQYLPGTSTTNEHEVALARQFFDGNAPGPSPAPAFIIPHHMPPPDLLRTADIARDGSGPTQAWPVEQHRQGLSMKDTWAAEFGQASQLSPVSPSVIMNSSELQRGPSYVPPAGMWGTSMPMGMYGMGIGAGSYQSYSGPLDQVQGKGKSRDADLEAAFDRAAASWPSVQAEVPKTTATDNDVANLESSLRGVTLETNKEQAATNQSSDLQSAWDDIRDSDLPTSQADIARWESEFNQLMNTQRDELEGDYGDTMRQAWENGLGDFRDDRTEEPVRFDNEGLPILGEYVFAPDNKYLGPSSANRSALNEAKRLLDQNGSLSEAALLLEAAIQNGELGEGGYESWLLLGETQNMDEREDAGLRALEEGVKRAEAAGAPGTGMLPLAISYTNESYEKAAHTMLLRWLRARYPMHPVPEETIKAISTNASWDTHARVTDAFLSLARHQHSTGEMDPDVQIGLGILFYSNGEYDRTQDCFESALTARPKDYLLWNRLGSSLSNGSKPEEALGAYRAALQLRPTYTRAIYNVGVACLNLGAHKEAAEHFLSALEMQGAGTSRGSSEQLWQTLRRAFLAMERHDLADLTKAEGHAPLEVFRKEGFDF